MVDLTHKTIGHIFSQQLRKLPTKGVKTWKKTYIPKREGKVY